MLYFIKSIFQNLFIVIVLSSVALTNQLQKNHNENHISIQDFEKSIDDIYQNIDNKKIFNAHNCQEYIAGIANFLLLKGDERYLPLNKKDFKALKRRGDTIVKKLFLLRLRLREKLKKFYFRGEITSDCAKKIRMAFRYSRFIEEFITETLVAMDMEPVKADPRNFSRHKRQFFLNPKYKNFHLKSGDIFIVRTSNFVSAIGSRIGDEDGQFSHAAMLYIDSKGEKQIVEAMHAEGVLIIPFEEWRKNDDQMRIALFRYRDEKLAKNAAQKLYDYIHHRWRSKGPILYDFKMAPGVDEFYCSELVQYAFRLGGESRIPVFPTTLHALANHTFLHDLTIEATEVFAPCDIEIEPLVDLVAEWKNYDITRSARVEDVIQTKVLRWMSYRNYQLKRTLKGSVVASMGIIARQYFGLNRSLLPAKVPYGFVENTVKLYDVNKVLEKYLRKKEQEYFEKHNHSMDYLSMMEALEKFRREDCEKYIARKKEMNDRILFNFGDCGQPYRTSDPLFHTIFNMDNGLECNAPVQRF